MTALAVRRPTVVDRNPPARRRRSVPYDVRQNPWSALVAVVPAAVGAAVFLRGMGAREMWNDEYATWHASTLPMADFGRLLRHTDLFHAAYYCFMHVWIAVAGDSPFALRFTSLAAMVAAAALVTLVGRRLLTTPIGLTAGMIFAVIPSISRYAQEARSYAMVSMVAVFATLMLLRALDKDSRLRLALYGLSVALLGLLHFVALTVLAAHAVLVLYATRKTEARRWRLVETVGIALLAVIPLLALASHQSAGVSWIKADAAAVRSFPEGIFKSASVCGVVIGLAVLGATFLLASRRPDDRVVVATLGAWALVPPIFCYVTFPVLHVFLPRYVLFVVPAWSILAAVAACRAGQLVWRHLWPLTAVVGVALVAWVGLAAQTVVRESPVVGQPDFRAAVSTIRDQLKPGDGIVYNDTFGKLSDLAREAFAYEMRREPQPRDVFLVKTAQQRGSFSASECIMAAPCLGSSPRVWLIYTGYSGDPFDGLAADRATLLRNDYKVAETAKYSGIKLVLLTRVG